MLTERGVAKSRQTVGYHQTGLVEGTDVALQKDESFDPDSIIQKYLRLLRFSSWRLVSASIGAL